MKQLWRLTTGFVFILITSLMISCGGGDDGPAVSTGYLKDSSVAGLNYVSGGRSGVTGADGSFRYEVGKNVTFSLGGVTVGTAPGKKVVTPVDFVASGSSTSTEVQNIVRFLLLLDEDGDPDNGISINTTVLGSVVDSWSVDFSTADLATDLAPIILALTNLSYGNTTLPDATTAQTHLEATMRCSYAGAFTGTYGGDSSGQFGVLVDAVTGDVYGAAYDVVDDVVSEIYGSQGLSYDQDASFVSGNVSDGSTFSGSFPTVDRITGNWSNSIWSEAGTFSGSRIGGSINAAYRFTGYYYGDSYGLFSIDVDASDNFTGVAYDIPEDNLLTISGSVSGSLITGSASDGTTISGTLDTSTGSLNGDWNTIDGNSGIFIGGGCKLN